MTNENKRFDLIGRIMTGLIDDHEALFLEASTMPRRVNWRAQVDINDTGKLIGKQAAHLYAMRVLITLMGQRYGEDWRLQVLDPVDGQRREKAPITPADDYNPSIYQDFIGQILDAILAETPEVKVARDAERTKGKLGFAYVIRQKSVNDYTRLVSPVLAGREEIAPIAALGTLFRAYGGQQGVNLRVELPR